MNQTEYHDSSIMACIYNWNMDDSQMSGSEHWGSVLRNSCVMNRMKGRVVKVYMKDLVCSENAIKFPLKLEDRSLCLRESKGGRGIGWSVWESCGDCLHSSVMATLISELPETGIKIDE